MLALWEGPSLSAGLISVLTDYYQFVDVNGVFFKHTKMWFGARLCSD